MNDALSTQNLDGVTCYGSQLNNIENSNLLKDHGYTKLYRLKQQQQQQRKKPLDRKLLRSIGRTSQSKDKRADFKLQPYFNYRSKGACLPNRRVLTFATIYETQRYLKLFKRGFTSCFFIYTQIFTITTWHIRQGQITPTTARVSCWKRRVLRILVYHRQSREWVLEA